MRLLYLTNLDRARRLTLLQMKIAQDQLRQMCHRCTTKKWLLAGYVDSLTPQKTNKIWQEITSRAKQTPGYGYSLATQIWFQDRTT